MKNLNAPAPRKAHRILIAEDNPVVQMVTRQILEQAGFDVEVVGDGKDALQALATADYDLVLMDAFMPGLDGLETTRRIRNANSPGVHRHIPIIALTGLESEGDRQACIEAGMDDYLEKPVEAKVLISAINSHLDDPSAEKYTDHSGAEAVGGIGDDIIDRFLDEIPQMIDDVEQIRHQGDLTGLRKIGHRIKGAADLLGTTALSKRSRALEAASKGGDLSSADACAKQLVEELQSLLLMVQSED